MSMRRVPRHVLLIVRRRFRRFAARIEFNGQPADILAIPHASFTEGEHTCRQGATRKPVLERIGVVEGEGPLADIVTIAKPSFTCGDEAGRQQAASRHQWRRLVQNSRVATLGRFSDSLVVSVNVA